jgi:hypothetical protein
MIKLHYDRKRDMVEITIDDVSYGCDRKVWLEKLPILIDKAMYFTINILGKNPDDISIEQQINDILNKGS